MAISSKSFVSTPVLLVLLSLLTVVSLGIVGSIFAFGSCPFRQQEAPAYAGSRVYSHDHHNVGNRALAEGQTVFNEQQGFLGIEITTVDARTIHCTGVVSVVPGVLVVRTLPQFKAYEAGFDVNDIITHVNGQRITDSVQLRRRVAATRPGTRLDVAVIRDGQPLVLHPTVGAKPEALVKAEMRARNTGCPHQR